jgi:rare lipoprotein A
VTNRSNGKTIVVMINDRGPFVRGRIIDLTPAGARALGFSGLTRVTIERIG